MLVAVARKDIGMRVMRGIPTFIKELFSSDYLYHLKQLVYKRINRKMYLPTAELTRAVRDIHISKSYI